MTALEGLHHLLHAMIDRLASDLFLSPGAPPCLKVDGKMIALGEARLEVAQVRELVLAAMSEEQRVRFETEREANFALSLTGKGRFRISAFYQRSQMAMVVRRIEVSVPQLASLGLPDALARLMRLKNGLVLVVGGTGSGKSTTLAAMIQERNETCGGHIICIEDPIEFVHPHHQGIVNQREVGIDTESFEVALKNTLRQAPDVIMIGEIRTRETMEYALAFAETGHLCLATLHANNANQALDRIIHFFPAERHEQVWMDLSLNLRAIIAQRLLPYRNGAGRAVAAELLLRSPLVVDLLRTGRVDELKEVMKRSTQQGMQTFDQALCQLCRRGIIHEDVALSHADSANDLRLMIKFDRPSSADGDEGLNNAASRFSLQDDDDFT
ncbi:PilT/PilU family type 4a pilus ATPase [Phytohalomonas tamaricis]|uniref:PilT/PilU family type 4a pilus ATPase n=1 Tax=Phytohalomonas tamaricis TaxID=2081032 RepID=UPI000D0B033B|nr:PilT/PilU family type 4a pilus ATPase [Phytohalomonas tamaricis]